VVADVALALGKVEALKLVAEPDALVERGVMWNST
jgi:hypothetical protein